jgi:cytochrome P450
VPPFPRQLVHVFSLIGKCLTHVKRSQRKAEQFLAPIIEERYQLPSEERPNDMLSWLMEDAVGEEREPRNLTLRTLLVNFAAIHTTSMVSVSFSHGIGLL